MSSNTYLPGWGPQSGDQPSACPHSSVGRITEWMAEYGDFTPHGRAPGGVS
jgi:hypothetical protein